MEDEDEKIVRNVRGHVKWFDPVKGFGFILSGEAGSDILLHANVLRNFGQNTVADGSDITVNVQETQRGRQAVEVLAITPPEGGDFILADEANTFTREEISACAMEPARVKWFDKSKGFGFANVFGKTDDVFIHIEVLRLSGFADLAAGEAITVRIIEGKRGRMAAQVLAWDAAARGVK